MIEGHKEAKVEFEAVGGPQAIEVINQYRELVNRNQVQGDERNIDFWRKQGWEKFKQFVVQRASTPSSTQIKRKKIPGNSITLRDDADWHIVIPLDKEASCFHGKHTDWCTTKPHHDYFEQYFHENEVTLVYCLQKATGKMWAIAGHMRYESAPLELFDQQDASLTEEQFKQQTGLDPRVVMNATKQYDDKVNGVRGERREIIDQIEDLLDQRQRDDNQETRDPQIETLLNRMGEVRLDTHYVSRLSNEEAAKVNQRVLRRMVTAGHLYFLRYLNPMLSDAELVPLIERNPYAIKHVPSPSGAVIDAALSREPGLWNELSLTLDQIKSSKEATVIFKRIWPDTEDKILKMSSHSIIDYAAKYKQSRWPAAEKELLYRATHPDEVQSGVDDAAIAVDYAVKVIKGRWPEFEDRMFDMTQLAFNQYCKHFPAVIDDVIRKKIKKGA